MGWDKEEKQHYRNRQNDQLPIYVQTKIKKICELNLLLLTKTPGKNNTHSKIT